MQQKNKNCIKCKENQATILLKEKYCKVCFLNYIEHAFKMTLKVKCGMTHKNMKLLICVSDGQQYIYYIRNSAALAQLTSDVMHSACQYNKNKMFFTAEVLHINESKNPPIIKNFIQECKLPYHELQIREFCPQLDQILENLVDYGSARQDLIHHIKLHMIYKFASDKDYSLICFAQNGQRLTAKLMSNLAKGIGLSINTTTKYLNQISLPGKFFLEQAEEDIKFNIAHPLRELMNKDVLYYLHCKGIKIDLDAQPIENMKIQKPARGNINHLLEDFIDSIQLGFSSTTFTVLSTADKVQLKPRPIIHCPICLNEKDQIYNKLESETLDNSNQEQLEKLNSDTRFYSKICFSCRRIFQQAKKIEDLYNLKDFPDQICQIAELI